MRVVIDASYARRGASGTGVYIAGVRDALRALGVDVVDAAAPPHRYLNLPVEWWWTHGRLPRRARGADLLHHALPALSARAPCPQVVTVHDLAFLRVPECFDPKFTAVASIRHRRAARGAAAVIVPSEATKADVRSRWAVPAERIVVAPHGPGQAPVGDRGEARWFLYVGDAEPRKNLGRLLDAYARYRTAAGEEALELVLAGAVTAAGAGLPASGVRLESAPTAERLAELHRHAAALVVPSLHEGFGLTALEAMHAGTPVLAASTAGLTEVCAGAARLCDPRDVDSIAAGLTELATVPPLREELRRRGLARAQDFSWENSARAHLAAYEMAIRSPR